MNLALVVPTRGRPKNAVRLAEAVRDTANLSSTTLHFVIDGDDPARVEYWERLEAAAPWAEIIQVPIGPGMPKRLGPVLNWAAVPLAERFDYVGFMGDDHLPKTPRWDEKLCSSLAGRPGVAYGDDLLQRENLPTACVISSELLLILGYMVPPGLAHLYLDDFWRMLGRTTTLAYRRDVIIEHLHPYAGKAEVDAVYAESGMNVELLRDDAWRYRAWQERENGWPADRDRLRKVLAQMARAS